MIAVLVLTTRNAELIGQIGVSAIGIVFEGLPLWLTPDLK
jgi:hypothetical protein